MGNPFAMESSLIGTRMMPQGGNLPPIRQPARGGAISTFKWGAIFGALAGVVNIIQLLLGALAVNANLNGLNMFESSSEFSSYLQCRQSSDPSNCAVSNTLPGADNLTAVLAAFYGTCFVAFIVTLVIYLFAARAASKESGRRGAGVWAAVLAAVVGSLVYLVGGLIVVGTTGRTGLLFGLGPFGGVGPEEWSAALVRATIFVDIVAMLFAVGIGALMGLWGAALGMRGVLPPGYPPAMVYGQPPYPAYPVPAMPPYPGVPQQPTMAPPVPAQASGQPNFSVPAQYPPPPSVYESQAPFPPALPPYTPASDEPTVPGGPAAGGAQ